MLMALVAEPYAHAAAVGLWLLGVAGQLAYGAWFSGRVWQGGRDPLASTSVLYLPTVGVKFVAAAVGGSLGYPAWGALFFGAGVLAWLTLESLILQRHAVLAPLPLAQRATLGIQLAPPVVGAMAYLSLTEGPPDLFVQALFGYALLQALLLLRRAECRQQAGAQQAGTQPWRCELARAAQKYAAVEDQMKQLTVHAYELRRKLSELVQRDADSYERVRTAYQMSKEPEHAIARAAGLHTTFVQDQQAIGHAHNARAMADQHHRLALCLQALHSAHQSVFAFVV